MGLKLILFLLFCSFCTVSHPSLFNWVFFLFLMKIMRSHGHWTEKNINLSSKCYVWPVCEGTATFRARSLRET